MSRPWPPPLEERSALAALLWAALLKRARARLPRAEGEDRLVGIAPTPQADAPADRLLAQVPSRPTDDDVAIEATP